MKEVLQAMTCSCLQQALYGIMVHPLVVGQVAGLVDHVIQGVAAGEIVVVVVVVVVVINKPVNSRLYYFKIFYLNSKLTGVNLI